MPNITFPHANNREVDLTQFVAAWKVWLDRFSRSSNWRTAPLPRLNEKASLQSQLQKNRIFSLDVLCRFLLPPAARNTMQATNVFMTINHQHLERKSATNPNTGRTVNGAKLGETALRQWDDLSQDKRDLRIANVLALLEGDIEAGTETEIVAVDLDPQECVHLDADNSCPEQYRFQSEDNRARLMKKLVQWIQVDPFQPFYRRRTYGRAVRGWDQRLKAYYWPKPGIGYAETVKQITPLCASFSLLANKLANGEDWGMADNCQAVDLAHQIFTWGGVPQNDVTADSVKKVVINALHGRIVNAEALMNSGWTKIAAFSTQHLEKEANRHPQVIWDSRVSTSIIHRLDRMIGVEAQEVSELFPELGIVAGRGGTRPRELVSGWRSGYGRWDSQFAGSHIVKEIRDMLNNPNGHYPSMPLPTGENALWTMRGVEMVLFGDGY